MMTNLLIALVVFAVFLAVLYLLSRRASSHDPAVLEELRRAALQGDVYAQFRLAQMYYEGAGVGRDDREAADWFLRAAKNDHADAQFILATMYEKGLGVDQNEEEAFRWYKRAASQGHERASVILESPRWNIYRKDEEPTAGAGYDRHTLEGKGDSAEKDALFNKYLEKASAGDVDAQYNLGVMYYHGEGVAVNHEEALRWFHMAAEQGDADAQYSLGCMYGRGEGTAKDHAVSLMWFRKAAENGHTGAREILEKMARKP